MPEDPKTSITLKAGWRPFILTKDGLLKEPTRDGYGYQQPVFDRDFKSVEDFLHFLLMEPGEPFNDRYEGEFVLLPVFKRSVHEKR